MLAAGAVLSPGRHGASRLRRPQPRRGRRHAELEGRLRVRRGAALRLPGTRIRQLQARRQRR